MREEKKSVGSICAGWWLAEINGQFGRARMARAQLRRADGPVAALGVKAVHVLNAALKAQGHEAPPDRLALIAVALAHLKDGQGAKPARAFGAGDPKLLSNIRFNAMIRASDMRDLWKPLIRALAVIKGQANVAALASDIFYWNDNTRTRWCFDYYGETHAAPTSEETTT